MYIHTYAEICVEDISRANGLQLKKEINNTFVKTRGYNIATILDFQNIKINKDNSICAKYILRKRLGLIETFYLCANQY